MLFHRPRWYLVVVTLLFVAVTVRLGFWQLSRGEAKTALANQMRERSAFTAVDWRGEVGESVWLRRFIVRGYWHQSAQIFLDNKVLNGRVGYYVLAPLVLENKQALLVFLGWMPKVNGVTPSFALPTQRVTLNVRLMPTAQHYVQLSADTMPDRVWQNLDWLQYSKMVGKSLVPALAYQIDGQDGLLRDWPAPDTGAEKNYAYAGQWFLFAGLAVVLFFTLHWKRRTT